MDSTQIEIRQIVDSLLQIRYTNDSIQFANQIEQAVNNSSSNGGNGYELIIAIVSIAIAVLSALFAWKSTKAAERTNRIGIFSELHQVSAQNVVAADIQDIEKSRILESSKDA